MAYFHWTGPEQHTNASQTVRAMSLAVRADRQLGMPRRQRPADAARPPTTWRRSRCSPKRSVRRRWPLAERPLGPRPPRVGDGRRRLPRHPARHAVTGAGMVGFGANLLLSQPDASVARAACGGWTSRLRRSRSSRRRRRWPTWCLPVSTAWEREGLRVELRSDATRASATCSCRRAAVRATGRGALGHLDRLRELADDGSASAIASTAVTRTPATPSCWSHPA